MSFLFFSFFPDFLAIFTSVTILGNAHRPCKQLSNITTPSLFFSWFFSYFFFIWNYKIYHIWQFLVFIPVTGFQYHSVPVNSGDCSGEITRISKFHGRSEILAGKFHWNGTRICRNDRNPAGICRASLRPCWRLWLDTGKKYVLVNRGGTKIRPGPVDIIPRVIFKPGSTWGPAQLGLIHWLTHITCWMNRPVDPPSQANLAGSIHLVGLADPLYQSLKK